jgi:hypothetical protein
MSKNELIKNDISSRGVFSYSWLRLWLISNFKYRWCFCCRVLPKAKDELFVQAEKKMKNELDILRIIK